MKMIRLTRLTCAICFLILPPAFVAGQPAPTGPGFDKNKLQTHPAQADLADQFAPGTDLSNLMAALLQAIAGDDTGNLSTQGPASPTLLAMGGRTVDLENIPANMLIDLLLPVPDRNP